MAVPPARARAEYDYHIKLLLLGNSGCDTSIKMTRANNVLKYQSLDQSLV
jgi:hypothetical protein